MMAGFETLFYKEVLRFWTVVTQTICAPIMIATMYLLIFVHTLKDHVQVYRGVQYISFLIPVLVMMSVLRNAFANTSSSLIQSKMTGNLVFVMLPLLSHWELFCVYALASVVFGVAIGLGIFVITAWFANLSFVALLSTMEVDRRYLGRQVRAVGGPPEFPDHARDFPRRRILFHSLVAAVLVSYFVSESVLLYD